MNEDQIEQEVWALIVCNACGNNGQIPLGEHFVTRAIDAGEPAMEGMSMGIKYGACPECPWELREAVTAWARNKIAACGYIWDDRLREMRAERDAAYVAGMREAMELAQSGVGNYSGRVKGVVKIDWLNEAIAAAIEEREGKSE